MGRSAAQRKAQRTYHLRRKVAKAPRSDDVQRAISQALRDTWPHYFTDQAAMMLLAAVLKEAAKRLRDRGFDQDQAQRRLLKLLRAPTKAILVGGKVVIEDASAPHGVRIVDSR